MYANTLLIVQAMYFPYKGQSVYYSTRGDFWKYLNGEFVVIATIKIHYSFIVCRITFSQEDVLLYSLLQSNISSFKNCSVKTE